MRIRYILLLALTMIVGQVGYSQEGTHSRKTVGKTASLNLPQAVRKGDVETVKKMVADKTDVTDPELLILAVSKDNLAIAQILLDAGADVNAVGRSGDFPLFVAKTPQMLTYLLKKGANPNQEKRKQTALAKQAKAGDISMMEAFFSKEGKQKLSQTAKDKALWTSVDKDQIKAVKFLLAQGADVNSVDEFGRTPLLIAANLVDLELTQLLLDSKAEIEQRDKGNKTALLVALEKNNPEVALALLNAGANSQAVGSDGRTALIIATEKEMVPVMKVLLKHPANINAQDKYGQTALMWAVATGSALELTTLLLEAGADATIKDGSGNTALYYAKRRERKDIQDLLLEKVNENRPGPYKLKHL